jgi:hypothetical protein
MPTLPQTTSHQLRMDSSAGATSICFRNGIQQSPMLMAHNAAHDTCPTGVPPNWWAHKEANRTTMPAMPITPTTPTTPETTRFKVSGLMRIAGC